MDFLRTIVEEDIAAGKYPGGVVTRFPPEPNGYLHIGHAKAICISFGIAKEYGGRCHLRFDDTNPIKEEQEFIDAIKEDVRWLGFDWGKHEYYASDYFERMYEWSTLMIKAGKAFVCDQTAEEISKSRGTLTAPGKESPFRNRSVEENLDLFARMKKGEFPDGTRTLRARIDPPMASPNINLRDPVMYRILHAHHHRTGDAWSIYPMYDWAHGESDWIEGITHSLCSLEFEDHRPLYEWFIKTLSDLGAKSPNADYFPKQREFNRLSLTHTIVTKRLLRELVEKKLVGGWDDPRMPTLRAMRRRGYPPAAIRAFIDSVGLSKRVQAMDLSRLEHAVREELNRTAPRVFGVLNPLKVIITNYPDGQTEELDAANNPEDETAGMRKVPFSKELWIEREDFMEVPPEGSKFFRLAPGKEVRLRAAYYITCTEVKKDTGGAGNVIELHCTYDPLTRGGWSNDGRKVKGTLHWVSAQHAIEAEVRLYDRLFVKDDPQDVEEGSGKTYLDNLNPESLTVLKGCKLEPSVAKYGPGDAVQFERHGYFCVDAKDSSPSAMVFNRTVSLKDSWAKQATPLPTSPKGGKPKGNQPKGGQPQGSTS